jgi:hypothetical protein
MPKISTWSNDADGRSSLRASPTTKVPEHFRCACAM